MVKKSYIAILLFCLMLLSFSGYILLSKTKESHEIKLGASLPLSGINQNLGKEIVVGANAYFNHINQKGGVNGKKIKFIYYDDKYEPEITWLNTKKLINKDKVFALFDFVGTPTVKKILPIIKDSDIPFIAPYTGASFLRNPTIKNIVNFRSSYEEEIDALVEYLVDKKMFRSFSIFYQNDDYGKEGYIALLNVLKSKGLELVSEGTYKRNTLFIKQALYDIKAKKPEAIILVGAYKPTARFIKKAREEKSFNNVVFCPISFVNANALIEELQNNGTHLLFSQTVPTYANNTPQDKEYLKLLKDSYPDQEPTFASFESFLAAKVLVNALNEIKGKISAKIFLKNIKRLKSTTLGGVKIHYKNSQLLNSVYLLQFDHGQFKTISER